MKRTIDMTDLISGDSDAWQCALRCIACGLLLLLLDGCAYNDNSHLRSAVPLALGQVAISLGHTNVPLLYPLHNFEPAEINTDIRYYPLDSSSGHTPLSLDIGLGNGFNLDMDMGLQLAPRFEGPHFDEPFTGFTYRLLSKASLQKSVDFGHGFYAALSPAISSGRGVNNIRKGWLSRFKHNSIELPFTLSKKIDISHGGCLVLSLTARAARDRLACDLNGGGTGAWTYITYPDQPLLKASRYAAMGTVEYRYKERIFMVIQWGKEEATVKSNSRLDPIFAYRLGFIIN